MLNTHLTLSTTSRLQVQHRGLRENSAVDLATIDFLVKALRLLAPDFDYRWLVAETRENLPKGEGSSRHLVTVMLGCVASSGRH